jgi:alcohol dehydrogenase
MPFQTLFDFRFPTHLIHGPGAITRLPEFLPTDQKTLIVTDKGLRAAGQVGQVTVVLDQAGIDYAMFDDVLGNPPARCVHAGQKLYNKEACNNILAIGGGSPMDVAKMIGVLATNPGRIERYLGPGKVENAPPPIICVPTTYGTGSEVTPFAVLTNTKTKNKDPVISPKIIPSVAVLDPELSVGLPALLGGATGMDALTHALESYINLLATPLTEGIALTAIQLIADNIRLACANDYELEATENMLIGSMLAGVAFTQTRLGNVHAMSHPVGAHFNVHHGLANAVLLPYVMEFNLPARIDKFAVIAEAMGTDTGGMDPYDAAHLAIDTVRQYNRDLGIPDKLAATGVKRSAIKAMSASAMQSGNIAVNPRKTTQDDIETIFRHAI